MVVIFGSPGLFPVYDVYELLDEKMKASKKPIFPVLPSIINVKDEIQFFIDKGRMVFTDEVIFGQAFTKTTNNHLRLKAIGSHLAENDFKIDVTAIRKIIGDIKENGYLCPERVQQLLDAAGIIRVGKEVASEKEEAVLKAKKMGFPIVMKVVGPIHKSDVGGVVLNISSPGDVAYYFAQMMAIKDAVGVLMQPMYKGTELFLGVKKEGDYGHLIFCGLCGIFVEVLKDVQNMLVPVTLFEAKEMIRNLKDYKIIQGVRGQEPVNEDLYAEFIVRLSKLIEAAPEITEMDVNPLIATGKRIVAVDARILVEKMKVKIET